MERLRIPAMAAAIGFVALVYVPVTAQTPEDAAPLQVRSVPGDSRPMPFPPDTGARRADSIEFRAMDRMTPRDRDLAADAEASIAEHAGRIGLEFKQGRWSYEQLVCPALPNHLFLKFARNNGSGDVSIFSASIPRGSEGRVRIIPILLRGYSLFSPTPVNALTISAFNHIRAEEGAQGGQEDAVNWLDTGLCYAALAGGRPQTSIPAAAPESQRFPRGIPAVLEIPLRGGAVIRFTDEAKASRPMEWTMTFDRKGRLVKATHVPVGLMTVNHVPPSLQEVNGDPLPKTVVSDR